MSEKTNRHAAGNTWDSGSDCFGSGIEGGLESTKRRITEDYHCFELLQYYHFICLDVFQKERPHLAKSLESWLDFLTIRSVEKMMRFLADNPDFSEIYGKAKNMMYDREALLMMLQSIFDHEDIAGSINRTNESMIKILEKKMQEKDTIISMQSDSLREKDSMLQEKDSMLQEKDSRLQEKDILIEQLKRQLGEKQ